MRKEEPVGRGGARGASWNGQNGSMDGGGVGRFWQSHLSEWAWG